MLEPVVELREVPPEERLHVGVRGGGREALVLAELAGDLVRERHGEVRDTVARELAGAAFVRGVRVRMDEADGNRLDTLGVELRESLEHSVLVERLELGAVGPDPAGDAEPQPTLHERRRKGEEEVVQVVPLTEADLEHVLEPPRRHDSGAAPPSLDDRVRDERRAVDTELHVGYLGADAGESGGTPGLGPDLRRLRSRQHLLDRERAGAVDDHDVRERPPDVECQPVSARTVRFCRRQDGGLVIERFSRMNRSGRRGAGSKSTGLPAAIRATVSPVTAPRLMPR